MDIQRLADDVFHRHRRAVAVHPLRAQEQFLHRRFGITQHGQRRERLFARDPLPTSNLRPHTSNSSHLVGQLQHDALRGLRPDALHPLHNLGVLRGNGVAQLVDGERREHDARRLVAHSVHTDEQPEHLALGKVIESKELVGILADHMVDVELHVVAFGVPQRLIGIERDFDKVPHAAAVDDGLSGLEVGQVAFKIFVHSGLELISDACCG